MVDKAQQSEFGMDAQNRKAHRMLLTVGEDFTAVAYTLTESLATAAEFDVSQYSVLTVQMIPTGEDLDQCDISYRNAAGSTREVVFNTGTDWTEPDGVIMINSNGVDATLLTDGAICSFRLDVTGYEAVRIRAAKASATAATLAITARGE